MDQLEIKCKFENISDINFFPKPFGVYKSKKNNLSLYWGIRTENKILIPIMQKYVFPGSWAGVKSKNLYNIWKKYHNKEISLLDIKKINKIQNQFNHNGVPIDWKVNYMSKFFPETLGVKNGIDNCE